MLNYWVKFQSMTASGGCDYEVVKISVIAPQRPNGAQFDVSRTPSPSEDGKANPSHSVFALSTRRIPGANARLRVYSVTGRRLADVVRPAGARLVWSGLDDHGARVRPGLYLYRLEVGNEIETGKWVLER